MSETVEGLKVVRPDYSSLMVSERVERTYAPGTVVEVEVTDPPERPERWDYRRGPESLEWRLAMGAYRKQAKEAGLCGVYVWEITDWDAAMVELARVRTPPVFGVLCSIVIVAWEDSDVIGPDETSRPYAWGKPLRVARCSIIEDVTPVRDLISGALIG